MYTLEELLDLENSNTGQRSEWVVNAPEPPGILRDILDFVKETIVPRDDKLLTLKDQPPSKRFVSVLQVMFPILCWCQNYDATKFKKDLVAGFTLASLCIPQVHINPKKIYIYIWIHCCIVLYHQVDLIKDLYTSPLI